jgi:hypothetical protein
VLSVGIERVIENDRPFAIGTDADGRDRDADRLAHVLQVRAGVPGQCFVARLYRSLGGL